MKFRRRHPVAKTAKVLGRHPARGLGGTRLRWGGWFVLVGLNWFNVVSAQTTPGILGGFDEPRIAALADQTNLGKSSLGDPEVTGEWARLVFQMRRLSAATLANQIDTEPPSRFRDVGGRVISLQRTTVPEPLSEFLELDQLLIIGLQPEGDPPLSLITAPDLPPLSPGDRLEGTVLVVDDQPAIAASGPLRWTPAAAVSPGLAVLQSAGVDLAAVRKVSRLAAVPLGPSDTSVFYPMIGVARRIGDRPPTPRPRRVGGVTMLGGKLGDPSIDDPPLSTGDWIATTVTMVRATRIGIQSPLRRDEIGGSHYWQIDAVAELNNVRVEVERPDGPPVIVGSRTPVTVVAASLPPSISGSPSGGDDALVLVDKQQIDVEGFFYRRWSYASDLMDAAGGGRQVAPLVIAAKLAPVESVADPVGVRWIGYVAAAGGLMLLGFGVVYAMANRRGDRLARSTRSAPSGGEAPPASDQSPDHQIRVG